jgi:hypothetical protein
VVRLVLAAAMAMTLGVPSAAADPVVRAEIVPAGLDLGVDLQLQIKTRTKKPSLGRRVKTQLTLWSNELGAHLNVLTLDLVDLRFDVARRHAAVRLGGLSPRLGFLVDGDIVVRRGVARVQTRLTLGLEGKTLELDLPAFELASQNVQGERSVEVRLPVFEGTF